MPIVKVGDKRIKFPDTMSQEEIGAALSKQFPQEVAPTEAPQQPEAPEDIFAGLPDDVVASIEERHPFRLTRPTAAGGLGVLPQRNIQEGQAKEAVLGDRRKAADFERFRIKNPFMAEEIEALSELDKAAIGFQTGLRTVARGATGLVGVDTFQQDPAEKESLKELGQVSGTFKASKIAGEAAPFLAASPLIGGGLTASVAGRALVPAARTLTGRAAGSAALGASEGAAIAKGEGKEGLEVAKAGVIGGVLGLGSEVAAPIVRSVRDLRTVTNKSKELLKEPTQKEIAKGLESATPSIDELKNASRDIYKGIDDLDVKLTDDSFESLSSRLSKDASKIGFKETKAGKKLTPQSAIMFDIIDDLKSGQVGVSDIDDVRRAAQNSASVASRAGNNQDAAINNAIVDGLDDFLGGINTKNLKGADVNVGEDLKAARKLWGSARKSELLDEAMREAKDQASGLENGLRIKFRQILRNKKQRRFFTKEEKKVMATVVQGTKGANLFKMLGKLGFGRGQQTNVLSGIAGAGVGTAAFGPIGAVVLPAIGTVSKALAERLTKKNAAFANQIIRAGTDAEEITKIYLRNTKPDDRSAEDLSQIFLREDIKLELVKSDIGIQAADIAKRNRLESAAALASIAAVPAVAAEEQ